MCFYGRVFRCFSFREKKNTPQDVSYESTQGYQDSDASPFNLNWNRRRRFSHQFELNRRRCNSLQRLYNRRSYEPRRRSSTISLKNCMPQPSDSESPTYSKHPQEKQTQTSPDKIEDGDRSTDSVDSVRLTPQPDDISSRDTSLPSLDEDLPRCDTKDVANSSNVTLPPSPELSIVEQISVRACSISRYNARNNTINEQIEINDCVYNPRRVSIVLDQLDFTCPLMEQEFTVASVDNQRNCDYNRRSAEDMEICATTVEDMVVSGNSTGAMNLKQKHQDTVTDSLISRVTEVNINDTPTLESIENGINGTTSTLASVLNVKQTGTSAMKRCSTPNKRKKVRKSQPPAVPSVAEEEQLQHTEYCVQKRRKSCPAMFHLEPRHPTESDLFIRKQSEKYSPIEIPQVIITPVAPIDTVTQRKPRKPKSKVIKVKILRPKKCLPEKKHHSKDRLSTGVTERNQDGDFSVKEKKWTASASALEMSTSEKPSDRDNLVHNHSDSCLAGHQCVADAFASRSEGSDRHELTPSPDCFSSEARDATRFSESSSPSTNVLRLSQLGSLLTEDATASSDALDEGQGWEEEGWAARSDAEEEAELRARYGAHISDLYPLVSAVPHLSTITEASSDTRSRDARSRDPLTFRHKSEVMSTEPSRIESSRDVQSSDHRAYLRLHRVCPESQPVTQRLSSDDDFVTCSSSTQYSAGMA